jgi:Na+/glutamate symporter
MKHAAIGLVVFLLNLSLLIGICSARGFDLSAMDQWVGLSALAAVFSGFFGGAAAFASWSHES